MKRTFSYIFFLATVCFSSSVVAQLVEKDKQVASLGHGSNIVLLFQNPTTKDCTLSFANRAYKVLNDVSHITFNDKDDYLKFIQALKSVDNDHIYSGDKYMISYSKASIGSDELWIYDENKRGYFIITKKEIKKYEAAAEKLK